MLEPSFFISVQKLLLIKTNPDEHICQYTDNPEQDTKRNEVNSPKSDKNVWSECSGHSIVNNNEDAHQHTKDERH